MGNNGSQLGVRQKPGAELSYAMHVFSVFSLNVYLFQRNTFYTFQNEAHAGGERHVAYEDSDPLTGRQTDKPEALMVPGATVCMYPRVSECDRVSLHACA